MYNVIFFEQDLQKFEGKANTDKWYPTKVAGEGWNKKKIYMIKFQGFNDTWQKIQGAK